MPAQITIRTDEELVARVKAASKEAGRSMNDYVTSVLDSATDPDLAGSFAAGVRERLSRAGLLADVAERDRHIDEVDPELLAGARRRAGEGTSLASLVIDGR